MKQRIDRLKNFGYASETELIGVGINGKLSEIHAALRLAQLKYMDQAKEARQHIARHYRKRLESLVGIRYFAVTKRLKSNYSYFPILVENQYPLTRDQLHDNLKTIKLSTRRYFYPTMTNLLRLQLGSANTRTFKCKVANDAAARVLCLPSYPGPESDTVDQIADFICYPATKCNSHNLNCHHF